MVNSIWKILRDPEDTDDVVQEVLMTILKKMNRIRRHPNPTALILRMCINGALNHVRRNRNRRRAHEALSTHPAIAAHGPNPREALTLQEQQSNVLAALESLPRRQAESITLLAVEGLSYPEIAEAMGCRKSTVRALVSKARKRLRAACGEPDSTLQVEVQES